MFSKNSRYRALPELTWRDPAGREVVYVARRIVPRRGGPDPLPDTDDMAIVQSGERLDNLTARTLSQPELFWKLCDANGVIDPFSLSGATGTPLDVPEE